MNHSRVLLLTAVLPEARALARAFLLRETSDSPGAPQRWTKDDIRLAVVGIRAGKLNAMAETLGSFDGVIMAGLAGALSPALSVGDVVVDAGGNSAALPDLGVAFLGRLHTSPVIVATPQEKAFLLKSTGCLAVDMETQPVAAFAAQRGAAFLGVRGISDSADEPLDPSLLTLVDEDGRPRIGRAVRMICRHPGKLPAMLRLGRATSRAMGAVAETVGKIIASGWPGHSAGKSALRDEMSDS